LRNRKYGAGVNPFVDCSARNLRGVAANLVEECGPYATMAALFLASESREDSDPEGAIFWTRVADAIPDILGTRAPGIRALCCGLAGRA
jgi:hypothetical protein